MLLILSGAVPLLVSVTACAELVVLTSWLLKDRLVGDRVTPGAVPVPERATVCGLPEAVSVMVRVPFRVPDAVGVKVTLMAQLAPAATLAPQLLVCANSLLMEMLVIPSE